MSTIQPDNVSSLPAAEFRRRGAVFVNHLRLCIAACKRTLVENLQEAQSKIAAKLSQSIYWVEAVLSKCHEEGDLLFFTIRAEQTHVSRNSLGSQSTVLDRRKMLTVHFDYFSGNFC